MSQTETLPVVPLRDAVLFPGTTAPITVGRAGTVRAIDSTLAESSSRVLVVTQKENVAEVHPDSLFGMGTIAKIVQVQRGGSTMQVLLHGEKRAWVVSAAETDGHIRATVNEASDEAIEEPTSTEFQGLVREVRERAGELVQKVGLPEEMGRRILKGFEEPEVLADLVSPYLELSTAECQALLEILSVEGRLRRVLVHLQNRLDVLAAQESIQSKVRKELGDRQREMVLREQMRAIREELGEVDSTEDLEELRERLDDLDLPEEARKEVDREWGRLQRMGRESQEAQVIRTFLETIAELPWNERTEDHLEIQRAAEILDEDHYALDEVKDRVLEFLAVRQLRSRSVATETEETGSDGGRAPILLFLGPPGVGKTSIARSIARAMGRKYVRISLGGARDEADIRGHRRTYVGAMAGRIIQGMRQAGSRNPVFLLDEVDKLGVSFQGDPSAALLEVLDPAQNDSFTDHYLGLPFDLSEVLFVCTANFAQTIPAPLMDRMEVVPFFGYTAREKAEIARRYLLPRQLEENGLLANELAITDEALSEIITSYTREAGVRQLERELGKVSRKVARKIANGDTEELKLSRDDLRGLLGRPRVHPAKAAQEDQVGVATGMYYTPVGGDIMFVEATTMPGKGRLSLTGQLGEVMKESAQAAWSYARAHAAGLQLDEEALSQDVHIHVPAGAVPKDGPSAGVAMATVLFSVLSGRPVRHDLAMTGEITLSGRILPIGGVKEKLLGALRAGIRQAILPKENLPDLEDLSDEVQAAIEVTPVEHLGEVLALALRDASFEDGRLLFGDHTPAELPPPLIEAIIVPGTLGSKPA